MSGERCSDIAQLQTIFEFDRIIIDSSVPWWQQKKIMEVAEKQNINCYNVNTQGAIVIDL